METLIIDTSKKWTSREYLQLEENPNQQLINGKLIMSPSPLLIHQKILKFLSIKLNEYAQKNSDELFFAPVDVFLDDFNVPQPDLVYILKENNDKLTDKGINGAPDLIVEIISPSNSYIDRYEKKALYQKFKVPEYWIVDPGNKTLEIYQLANENYELAQYLSESGQINSPILDSLDLKLEEIFVSG